MTDELNDSLDDIFGVGTDKVLTQSPAAREHIARTTAPGFVQQCWKCRGTGQTRWGACFACKGAGGKTFKTSPEARAKASEQRAERKATRELDAIQTWKAENRAAYEWLVATAPRWDLAQSLLNGLHRYGSLTEKQLAIVTKGIARDAARSAERAQKASSAPLVAVAGVDSLKAAFDRAIAYTAEKGLKLSPRITVAGITISPAKATSANPGALYVKNGSTYLGKVTGGRFFASRDCTPEAESKVLGFISDPADAAKVYGQTTGTCCVCNATLRSEWKHKGIGPICAEKFGW